MTAGRLIELLQALPPDTPICLLDTTANATVNLSLACPARSAAQMAPPTILSADPQETP